MRLAANQGHLGARNDLGILYATGMGVPNNRVVAYALYLLSEGSSSLAEDRATWAKFLKDQPLSGAEKEAAQNLSRNMAIQNNLLTTLDAYTKKPASKAAAEPQAAAEAAAGIVATTVAAPAPVVAPTAPTVPTAPNVPAAAPAPAPAASK